MIYTVTFNPALDYVMYVDTLSIGMTNRSAGEEIYYGGKGINVSVILSRLGIDNTALGFEAGFTGKEILKRLESTGIKTDFIELPSGMSRINIKLKSEKETEINGQGPEIPQSAIDGLFDKLDTLQNGDTVVLAGSIPKTLPSDMYEQIMKKYSDRGVRFVVDATLDLLVNVLKYHPFLIKPNNFELGEIFGVTIQNDEETAFYAKKLQEQGARNVLVSLGGDGAMLIDENGKQYRISALKGTVVNTVGSGDSMVAGFIAGYENSGDYEVALQTGSAAGSATAFSKELGTHDEIIENLHKIQNA